MEQPSHSSPSLENLEGLFADVEAATANTAAPEVSSPEKPRPDTRVNVLLHEIDGLAAEVNAGIETTRADISNWSLDKKRAAAMDISDPFTLIVLSGDASPIVRTLIACNPEAPVNTLKQLIETSNDHLRMVAAHNPSATPELLDRLIELTDEPEVIRAVMSHPNISSMTAHRLGVDDVKPEVPPTSSRPVRPRHSQSGATSVQPASPVQPASAPPVPAQPANELEDWERELLRGQAGAP